MFEYAITEECGGAKGVAPKGRIDALSAPELQRLFDDLVMTGQRRLVTDMSAVSYVSSAGLRVFLSAQKQLKKVGGEVILLAMQRPVRDVFDMSGLKNVLRVVATRDELTSLLDERPGASIEIAEIDGLRVEYLEGGKEKGSLFTIGAADKVAGSSYTEADVVPVTAGGLSHGCGFATVGDRYQEYKGLFGESMVVNGNFFFYPAVKHPSVDFLINARANPAVEYRFLHGFGFNGPYRYVLSFDAGEKPVELGSLMDGFLAFCKTSIVGVILIAESKGIWGMHLKKVPLADQQPAGGKSIFDPANFPEWVDFPIEPTCANEVVVAVGIAGRKPSTGEFATLMGEGNNCHLHGGVFGKSPLSKDVGRFDEELLRIFTELSASRIEHLLGWSRFSSGLAALVDLEG
jgi:anti-anti-sigma factor